MSKSHVSIEQKICKVTGKPYETNGLLLDRRMKDSLEHHTVTGWGISPEVQQKFDEGFFVLVVCDESKSDKTPNGNIKPEGAYRLGEIVYLKEKAFFEIFNVPKETMSKRICFIGQDLYKFLQKLESQL